VVQRVTHGTEMEIEW